MLAYPPVQSVASELLVNDRTLVISAPPLSCATLGDFVWIALADGNVEVRNARTGEVVRRFMPALTSMTSAKEPTPTANTNTTVNATLSNPAPARSDIFANITNRLSVGSPTMTGLLGASVTDRKKSEDNIVMPPPKPSSPPTTPVTVRCLLAVPTARNGTHIWLGLSNGCVEVHEGGGLLDCAAVNAPGNGNGKEKLLTGSFVAMLHKHASAVTCLAEFGGYVYSGSEDQQIIQWWASNSMFARLFGSCSQHAGAIRCLYAEGNALVSGADDGTVKVWDVGEGTMRLTGYFHSRNGAVLSLCRVGECMWSGDAAGQVVRWHIRTCEAVDIHCPHRNCVLSLCQVGDRVYSGSADGTMGIFNASTGEMLQQVTDQAQGWVTLVTCPAELSRFVLWSSSADGAVRCWYQDEYVSMSADEARFNDGSWYESGSTPYRELRATVGQRTHRLKQQLRATEQRDAHAMSLLRRCSTVFGGGGQALELQQQRLQEQLRKMEERYTTAQSRLKEKREAVAQVDKDIAATLALLQSTESDLNLLIPGEAQRVLSVMPAVTTQDVVAYTPPPPAVAAAAAGPTMTGESAAAPPPAPPLPQAAEAPSAYATSTVMPSGLPVVLPPLPAAPPTTVAVTDVAAPVPISSSVPTPPAATTSTLGVGGPLSTEPPPPLPPLPESSSVPAPSPPPAADTGVPAPAPAPADATITATAAPVRPLETAAAIPPSTLSPPLPAASIIPVANPIAAAPDTITWTNPHVGNYIQRRYYGASPSLRTTDLMQQERRRQSRLPRVKVEPLPSRTRSHSASAAASRTNSATSKKEATATTVRTATEVTTTASAGTR